MACALPHTDFEVEALVQKLINEDKGRQDVLLNLAFQFENACAVRDDLRKTYERCNDISQESRALICTLLKESSKKDRELYLSMYGKAAQIQKQMDAKSAWLQEKDSGRTHRGLGGLEFSEFVHDPQHACSRSSSLAVTSSGLSSDVSDVGLPSKKVMESGKNDDDGDLLPFRDGPGACDISVGALRLFIAWECSRPVAGVKVNPSSGTLLESD
ncbi:hypothetical protein Tco_0321597 [Tanacetum coccineum]